MTPQRPQKGHRDTEELGILCCCAAVAMLCFCGVARAEEVEPLKESQKVEALAHYMEARQAFEQGRVEDAASALEKAYVISPGDSQIQQLMAQIETARWQRQQAIEQAVQSARQPAPPQPPEAAGVPVEDVTASAKPLKEHVKLPGVPSVGFDRYVTPPEEGRPEILEAGKRAGFQRLYKEGIGLQPIRGLGFSARTEIYDEPNPVEDYILESKILNFSEISQFRRSILPLFTRSWAARMVADYEPLPRFTYEFDNRDIYHEFETRFGFKNRNLETHAVNALYTFPRMPFLGRLTLNPWYKRVIQESDQDAGTFENKDEIILNFSLQPTENLEYFFQFDGYDSHKERTVGASKLKLYKGQVRMRFPKLKLFVIPSYEYSDTDYDPSDDEFTKRDLFVDWGFDLTKRLRVSSKEQAIKAETSQPGKFPSNPDAEVFNTYNTLSYELFKDFDVSFGVDYSKGFGYSTFNNVGLRAEMELFKPGLIRAKFGYEWVSYYNIQDDLSLLYLRLFLFQ